MAGRIAKFDWASTSLGAMSNWPESLRIAVAICLTSPVPSFVWWGQDLINIYNDPYAPLLGGRHPAALGAPARKVWRTVWPIIGNDVEGVLHRGESVVRECVRFVVKRKGFPDEMFFTYTFSPIPDGHGGIGGVFQVAIDETSRVRAERPLPKSELCESPDERAKRTARHAASAAEALLEHMNLTPQEQEFCKSMGIQLVEDAIHAYLNTLRQKKGFDGSCIAASLAVALIAVHDL